MTAIGLLVISGAPGLFIPRASPWNQRLSALLVCLGSLTGMIGAGFGMSQPDDSLFLFPWMAARGSLVGIDALSAFFLFPVFIVGSMGSIYGLGYWPSSDHEKNGRKLQLSWGTLMAGMVLLVVSRHAMAFIIGWEFMAISAFFLVSTEDDDDECRKSGIIYFIATHFGTLTLFGLFALWRRVTGSFDFVPLVAGTASIPALNALFFLTLTGFGLKAGIMPLHFWLPGAHANAPSHVSAILSGVMLKMGIYGIVRMLSLLPDPPALWGGLLLAAGAASGILGVAFALAQHDIKRLLAYHSVENIGIITMGLGLAMLGRTYDRPAWTALGMAGCLLHVWNHSLFKSLLFFGAGSVVHGTGTRRIDSLGGLARRMPWTAALFLAGAVAICGLPPLNGFISEFFIYLGLFRTAIEFGQPGTMAFLAVPVLAMTGALAVACFVKVYGAVFLGLPRTGAPSLAHEAPLSMLLPMAVLALLCLVIGLAPGLMLPMLDKATTAWQRFQAPSSGLPSLAGLVPSTALTLVSAGLLAVIAALAVVFRPWRKSSRASGTWDCGYARPGSTMQYTASSFADTLVRIFSWVLKPRTHRPSITGPFPGPSSTNVHVDELILDRSLLPLFRSMRSRFVWFHRFQQGLANQNIILVIAMLLAMMATLVPFRLLIVALFS